MTDLDFDPVAFFSNFVPGAIASDFVRPGAYEEMVVWGTLSMLTGTYFFPGETAQEKAARYLYRVYPFYGGGVGYFIARAMQFPPSTAVIGAVVGAAIAYGWKNSSTGMSIDAKTSSVSCETEPSDRQHATFTNAATPPRGQSLM